MLHLLGATGVLVVTTIMFGCGRQGPLAPVPSTRAPADNSGASADQTPEDKPAGKYAYDVTSRPAKDYGDATFALRLSLIDETPDAKAVVWVNFDGATVAKGVKSGQSFLVCGASAIIAPSKLTTPERDAIVKFVQGVFDQAGAPVTIATEVPARGAYTSVHVGGFYKDLGCGDGQGQIGAAPLDLANLNPADVAFVFSNMIRDWKAVAFAVAHEVGHTYGLEHTSDPHDVMYGASGPSTATFLKAKISVADREQDGAALLRANLGLEEGGSAALAAVATPPAAATEIAKIFTNLPDALKQIPGLDQLAALAKLLPELTPDQIADITKLLPAIAKALPAGIKVPELARVLTLIAVAQKAATTEAAKTGGVGAGISGVLNPKTIGSIAILAGMAGAGDITAVLKTIGILGTVLNPTPAPAPSGAPAPQGPPSLSDVPNLAIILGLDKVKNLEQLLALLQAQVKVIRDNVSGPAQTALISTLKLAFAQEFETM